MPDQKPLRKSHVAKRIRPCFAFCTTLAFFNNAALARDIATVAKRGNDVAVWVTQMRSQYGTLNRPDSSMLDLWIGDAELCRKAARDALSSGVPASTPIDYLSLDSGLPSPVALGEFDAKVCSQALAIFQGKSIETNTEEAARLAPFLAALTGDKRRIFQEAHLQDLVVRGPGGVRLNTPKDFARASAWYTSGINENVFPSIWKVDGWQFTGDKLRKRYRNSGLGTNYPAHAFP